MRTISVGQLASVSKSFSNDDVRTFADLSLDHNPIHIEPDYAAQTLFGKQIVHGMLVSSLFSGLLGQHLPGEGTIYLSQSVNFRKPVFIDQQVTASVEVTSVREDKPIITLKTICVDESGEVLVDGEAVILYNPV